MSTRRSDQLIQGLRTRTNDHDLEVCRGHGPVIAGPILTSLCLKVSGAW